LPPNLSDEAVNAARKADVVIAVVGIHRAVSKARKAIPAIPAFSVVIAWT